MSSISDARRVDRITLPLSAGWRLRGPKMLPNLANTEVIAGEHDGRFDLGSWSLATRLYKLPIRLVRRSITSSVYLNHQEI